MPDFRSPEFLLGHVRHTLSFYEGRCIDPTGGFFHFYKDDGTVYDRRTRHLVSSTRFVFNHAMAFRHFGKAEQQAAVRHGLDFLKRAHAQPQGGYAWQVDWQGYRVKLMHHLSSLEPDRVYRLSDLVSWIAEFDPELIGSRASVAVLHPSRIETDLTGPDGLRALLRHTMETMLSWLGLVDFVPIGADEAGVRDPRAVVTILDLADFTEADLTAAKLMNADLKGANFTHAILRRAKMNGADLRVQTAKLPNGTIYESPVRFIESKFGDKIGRASCRERVSSPV